MRKPITWDENQYPTPTQWLEGFDSHIEGTYDEAWMDGREDQLDIVEMILVQLGTAATSLLQVHDLTDRVQELERQLMEVNEKCVLVENDAAALRDNLERQILVFEAEMDEKRRRRHE